MQSIMINISLGKLDYFYYQMQTFFLFQLCDNPDDEDSVFQKLLKTCPNALEVSLALTASVLKHGWDEKV